MKTAASFSFTLLFALASAARAQAPDDAYRTIETAHFFVHFPSGIEHVARRAGGSAERAYAALAPLLAAPHGRIDLVVTDHVDYSNGFAVVSPTPRIVVYARPPVDDRTLRFRDDWMDLVIQHELVHVFHLERTRGWWRVPRAVFGRQPLLFPNMWAPSWLLEGLAVYYESKLGDGGRLEGMAHQQYVNARAVDGTLPRLGQLSAATLDFPGGTNAYVYGSLFLQSMAGRRPGGIEDFVERTSGRWNPFAFNAAARQSFGVTFSAQWDAWRDSVMQAVHGGRSPDGRRLTTPRWFWRFPRLTRDDAERPRGIYVVASDGRDVAGLYRLSPGDTTRLRAPVELHTERAITPPFRVARRNSLEPNVPVADGRIVFTQGDHADPWRYRSDLWVREPDGHEHQVTHGARLFASDARWTDGAVVAVQNVAGTTRLVRVGAQGAIVPLTAVSLDTNWSAPRWSRSGRRIAATRWVRGGVMSIVVLDTLGRVERVLASARAVVDAPSWGDDDRTIFFAANTDGLSRVWTVDVRTGALRAEPAAVTAVDAPEATHGAAYLAIETRGGGEGVMSAVSRADRRDSVMALPTIASAMPPARADTASGAVQLYRPWRQLVPRYWLPDITQTDENHLAYGATITSSDIIGRHFYAATLAHEPTRAENTGAFVYRYAGFGLPLVDLAVRQTWDHTPIADSTNALLGTLGRRRRFVGTALTLVRQRVRTAAVLSASAELELRDFVTDPAPLLDRLGSPLFLQTLKYPTFALFGSWANTRTPILALGPEDGLSVSGTLRTRWRTDAPSTTHSSTYIAAASGFKSIPFIAGPSHHVVALRGVVGVTDDKTNTELEAGGVSGSAVELAPGIAVGDVRREFFVRGFAPGAQIGTRALGGSAEWRAPIAMPGWGRGFVPFFAQRVSALLFADAGTAWCPAGARAQTVACPAGPTPRRWMSSAGAELMLDAAVLNYDVPYRLRAGYARPVQGSAYAGAPNGSVYFSIGLSF